MAREVPGQKVRRSDLHPTTHRHCTAERRLPRSPPSPANSTEVERVLVPVNRQVRNPAQAGRQHTPSGRSFAVVLNRPSRLMRYRVRPWLSGTGATEHLRHSQHHHTEPH
jgi:hypothetical protein